MKRGIEIVKIKAWENKVTQFLHNNNNELIKLNHDKQEITFRLLDYDKAIYTTSYEKLKKAMLKAA